MTLAQNMCPYEEIYATCVNGQWKLSTPSITPWHDSLDTITGKECSGEGKLAKNSYWYYAIADDYDIHCHYQVYDASYMLLGNYEMTSRAFTKDSSTNWKKIKEHYYKCDEDREACKLVRYI